MKTEVRIDKWLWAVRLYKTRALATDACRLGKVICGDVAAKASREVSSGVLYQVFVVCNNALERLYQNLTKDEAEALYVKFANEWYRYDGTFDNVDDIQNYRDSGEYLDKCDMANVVMETM